MRRRFLWLAATAALLVPPAFAEPDLPQSPHPELLRTFYDYGVAEYCGLVDPSVHNGFALLRLDQLARGHIGPAAEKSVRIEALKAVDYEYQDRGLSGQKTWCRTEGGDAVRRFTAYFRTRQLPPPSP